MVPSALSLADMEEAGLIMEEGKQQSCRSFVCNLNNMVAGNLHTQNKVTIIEFNGNSSPLDIHSYIFFNIIITNVATDSTDIMYMRLRMMSTLCMF